VNKKCGELFIRQDGKIKMQGHIKCFIPENDDCGDQIELMNIALFSPFVIFSVHQVTAIS